MTQAPDTLLLIGPGCPHCASVLQHLQTLIKEAALGELRIVNVAAKPEIAAELNVRSVPWIKLGEFELEGAHSLTELREWIARASSPTGMADYYADLLARGQRAKIVRMALERAELREPLFTLAADLDRGMDIRVGVGAIMEELAEHHVLADSLEQIIELTRSEEPTIRADGAHYLSMTGSKRAMPVLLALREDEHPMVREVVADALEELGE